MSEERLIKCAVVGARPLGDLDYLRTLVPKDGPLATGVTVNGMSLAKVLDYVAFLEAEISKAQDVVKILEGVGEARRSIPGQLCGVCESRPVKTGANTRCEDCIISRRYRRTT